MNLYLHKLEHPNIKRQNTLVDTAGDRTKWDIILANPPFAGALDQDSVSEDLRMGTRATEVLFLKYIIDHLSQNGRAGVIVPEGVVFNNSSAHKKIRQILVEDAGLWCVVSLPSGVFNPYSGVKTSILFLDRELAKLSDSIVFMKISNDGYDLGAQRRKIDKDDLPNAQMLLNSYKRNITAHNLPKTDKIEPLTENTISIFVPKSIIRELGDYYLAGERYKEINELKDQKWPMVELGEICDIESGSRQKGGAISSGVPSIGGEQIDKGGNLRFEKMKFVSQDHYTSMKKGILRQGDVLIVKDGATTGKTAFFDKAIKAAVNEHVFIFRAKDNILPKYLYNLVRSDLFQHELQPYIKGIIGGISLEIKRIKIPLPAMEVQKQIVEELDGYQKIIDGVKQVVESWKPLVNIDSSWDSVSLPEICEIKRGKFSFRPRNAPHLYGGKYPFIQTGDVVRAKGGAVSHTQTLNEEGLKVSKLFQPTIVLITIAANIGDTAILNHPACFPDSVVGLVPTTRIDPYFLQLMMATKKVELENMAPQMAQKNINIEILKQVKIPLPPLEIQKQIVTKIESERQIIEGTKKLIEIYQQKTEDRISGIWIGNENK